MDEKSSQQLRGITSYHPHDVICGRGPRKNEGNEKYHGLVHEKRQVYRSCKRAEKGRISRLIVDAIRSQDPPGRFLEQDRKTGLWYDIGDKKAMERTKQCLRETGLQKLSNADEFEGSMVGGERSKGKELDNTNVVPKRGRSAISVRSNNDGAGGCRETSNGRGRGDSDGDADRFSEKLSLGFDETTNIPTDERRKVEEQGREIPTEEHDECAVDPLPFSASVMTGGEDGEKDPEFNPVLAEPVLVTDTCNESKELRNSNEEEAAAPQDSDETKIAFRAQDKGVIPASLTIANMLHEKSMSLESLPLIKSSASTRIYRLEDKENSFGGRTGAVAIKMLTADDGSVDAGAISCLYNEYILSRHLAECTSVRGALGYDNQTGFRAVYLEWATGVTLREWSLSFKYRFISLERIMHVAEEISRSVNEMHDAGVVHNNINPNNIIVDEREKEISIKLVDLGLASLFDENESVSSSTGTLIVNKKRKDLFCLGTVLYELFSGIQDPLHESDSLIGGEYHAIVDRDRIGYNSKRANALEGKGAPLPLHKFSWEELPAGLPVPMSVSVLVHNLLEAGLPNERYQSVNDVTQDLHMMRMNPDHFLVDSPLAKVPCELEFPDKLYGRESHMCSLVEMYDRVFSGGSSELVMITGKAGSGKTVLVQQLRNKSKNRAGYFISGKFDRLRQVEPLSAVITAFNEYGHEVLRRGGDYLHQAKSAIKAKVGNECTFLTDLIPALSRVIGNPVQRAGSVSSHDAQNRFRVIFRLFVQAIAMPSNPVVLFLDDLQWADAASLYLIESLVTDTESKSLLFIGAYRDNEVSPSHQLSLQLREIENQGVRATKIKVENISKSDVDNLVAVTLCASQRLVRPLTDLVYDKTNGNAFFVTQFLKSLADEGLLWFSVESRRWEWDIKAIEQRTVGEDAVELMANKIRSLPENIQDALMLAASLGCSCEESILGLLISEASDRRNGDQENGLYAAAGNNIFSHLHTAVACGLMEKNGEQFIFAHDQIQHAAYSLIPNCQRDYMHLSIGNCIRRRASASKLEEVLFLAVDQMNKGASSIRDEREKVELAMLNLRAGEKAMSSSSFLPATTYLKAGIDLLGPSGWEQQYNLTLRLYDACVECEYCTGNFNEMGDLLEQILTRAICFHDKIHAYHNLIFSLGAQNKLSEAIQTGLMVLGKLEEPLPLPIADGMAFSADSLKFLMRTEMTKTNDLIDAYSDKDILALNDMDNDNKAAAMKFLYQMMLYANLWKRELFPFIAFRMIQLSVIHGICRESAFGFASLAVFTLRAFRDIKRADRFGQMSLALLVRSKDDGCLARVHGLVYGCINPWTRDLRLSKEPLLQGFHVGMRTGDIEYAMVNAGMFLQVSFLCADRLAHVEEVAGRFCKQMVDYKQDTSLYIILPLRQTVLNLMGRSEIPWKLSGKAMDCDELLKRALEEKNGGSLFFLYAYSMYLAYLFGEYELASEMAEKRRGVSSGSASSFELFRVFCDGLVFLALASKTKESKWKTLAEDSIAQMKDWVLHAPCNCKHKLDLLEAEYALLLEDYSQAAKLYDSAIMMAGERKLIQDQALGYERAAMFHLSSGDESRASHYYDHAYNAYLQWGAQAKADHVRCRSLSLLMVSTL